MMMEEKSPATFFDVRVFNPYAAFTDCRHPRPSSKPTTGKNVASTKNGFGKSKVPASRSSPALEQRRALDCEKSTVLYAGAHVCLISEGWSGPDQRPFRGFATGTTKKKKRTFVVSGGGGGVRPNPRTPCVRACSGEEGRFDVAARSETPNHLPKPQTATVATAQRPK